MNRLQSRVGEHFAGFGKFPAGREKIGNSLKASMGKHFKAYTGQILYSCGLEGNEKTSF